MTQQGHETNFFELYDDSDTSDGSPTSSQDSYPQEHQNSQRWDARTHKRLVQFPEGWSQGGPTGMKERPDEDCKGAPGAQHKGAPQNSDSDEEHEGSTCISRPSTRELQLECQSGGARQEPTTKLCWKSRRCQQRHAQGKMQQRQSSVESNSSGQTTRGERTDATTDAHTRAEPKKQTLNHTENSDDATSRFSEWIKTTSKEAGMGFSTINVTSLWSTIYDIAVDPIPVQAIMEVVVPAEKLGMVKKMALKLGMTLVLSGPDPEQSKTGAGVGVLVKKPGRVSKLKMSTEAGEKAFQLGRLIKTAVSTGDSKLFGVIVAYGWTDADKDEGVAARTDALVYAAMLEEKT